MYIKIKSVVYPCMFRQNSSIFREFVYQNLQFNQAQYITVTVHIIVISVTIFKYTRSYKIRFNPVVYFNIILIVFTTCTRSYISEFSCSNHYDMMSVITVMCYTLLFKCWCTDSLKTAKFCRNM